jgi:hypothetical protein
MSFTWSTRNTITNISAKGGLSAVILAGLNAINWLRLYA